MEKKAPYRPSVTEGNPILEELKRRGSTMTLYHGTSTYMLDRIVGSGLYSPTMMDTEQYERRNRALDQVFLTADWNYAVDIFAESRAQATHSKPAVIEMRVPTWKLLEARLLSGSNMPEELKDFFNERLWNEQEDYLIDTISDLIYHIVTSLKKGYSESQESEGCLLVSPSQVREMFDSELEVLFPFKEEPPLRLQDIIPLEDLFSVVLSIMRRVDILEEKEGWLCLDLSTDSQITWLEDSPIAKAITAFVKKFLEAQGGWLVSSFRRAEFLEEALREIAETEVTLFRHASPRWIRKIHVYEDKKWKDVTDQYISKGYTRKHIDLEFKNSQFTKSI